MKINLQKLALNSKRTEFAFPGIENFKVTLNFLSRGAVRKLQEDCRVQKIDEQSGLPYQDLDIDKYTEEYCKATIVGWSGLTIGKVASLILIDEDQVEDPDAEIEFDIDTATFLIKNSERFDSWVTMKLDKLDNFRN